MTKSGKWMQREKLLKKSTVRGCNHWLTRCKSRLIHCNAKSKTWKTLSSWKKQSSRNRLPRSWLRSRGLSMIRSRESGSSMQRSRTMLPSMISKSKTCWIKSNSWNGPIVRRLMITSHKMISSKLTCRFCRALSRRKSQRSDSCKGAARTSRRRSKKTMSRVRRRGRRSRKDSGKKKERLKNLTGTRCKS